MRGDLEGPSWAAVDSGPPPDAAGPPPGASGRRRGPPRHRRALVPAVLALVLARPATGIAAARRYDTQYLFSATRALAADSMADGWKAVLAPATVVIDVASLPFAFLLGLGGLVPASGDADEG